MNEMDHSPKAHSMRARLGALAAMLLCLGLLASTPAQAGYEQVDTFAGTPGELHPSTFTEWPEEVQLGGLSGMAVNVNGVGGVPPGTFYAATRYSNNVVGVARFNPDGEFRAFWTFQGDPPNERCGPDGDPGDPVCKSRPTDSPSTIDVDINQTTGHVYLLNAYQSSATLPGTNLIHVYNADGSDLISEFGVRAVPGETTAASPEKIHSGAAVGGIAVDAAGKVFVADSNDVFDGKGDYRRLMVFEPQSPGDYEHYVYAGQSQDVAAGFQGGAGSVVPAMPVTDAAGDLYARGGVGSIVKLDPDKPADPVLCKFDFPKSGITSITVNPISGEVFFYSVVDKVIHQLEPCSGGKFVEAGKFGVSPKRNEISAMAFNPARQLSPGRPAGVLYAGSPEPAGGKSEAEPPNVLTESALGYIFALPEENPPTVESQSVDNVTTTTAELGAQINPNGSLTDYVFQYITEAAYEANEPSDRFAGAAEAPLGGGLLGEGFKPISAGVSLIGLEPDTTYHYRVVATSNCSDAFPENVCEGTGADESFHTFPIEPPVLPDGRVYELVSPPEKQSGQVLPADSGINSCGGIECKPGNTLTHFPMLSTPDGEAIVYEGTSFSSEEGAAIENQYIAHRDAKAGWQTTNLTPLLLKSKTGRGYKAFDTNLTTGLLAQVSPALSPEAPPDYANLYSQPTSDPLALSPSLTAEPLNRSTGQFKLEYAGASNDLSRVFFAANDALTQATPFSPAAQDGGASKDNLYEWAEGQLRLVNVLPGNTEAPPGASFGHSSANAISDDGSRAFLSDEAGQVYVREDAEVTEEIPGSGKFLSAATDGSKVLLTDGSLYDLGAEASTDLTDGKGGFQGIAGQSDDLSSVYFIATSVLDETPSTQGAVAEAGKFNLYAWSEGATRYVATPVAQDNSGYNGLVRSNAWASSPTSRTAEASPSGGFLAFLSYVPLTGYDNTGPCKVISSGPLVFGPGPCLEVFLYDSSAEELICVSCNPSGVPPLGHSNLTVIAGNGGGTGPSQPRYLTDEGRLYFDSRDALTPADTNSGVEDVYQYEPEGVGGCKRAAGCVSLISAGREPIDSNFLAMDETGKSVFFTTRDQLVLRDKDDLIDLYVAREGGGIPAETEVARTECQGEACVAAYSPPNDPTPGSSTFDGAGNVDEKKAQKKSKKAKKKKRKQAKKNKRNKRAKARANHNRGGAK